MLGRLGWLRNPHPRFTHWQRGQPSPTGQGCDFSPQAVQVHPSPSFGHSFAMGHRRGYTTTPHPRLPLSVSVDVHQPVARNTLGNQGNLAPVYLQPVLVVAFQVGPLHGGVVHEAMVEMAIPRLETSGLRVTTGSSPGIVLGSTWRGK